MEIKDYCDRSKTDFFVGFAIGGFTGFCCALIVIKIGMVLGIAL